MTRKELATKLYWIHIERGTLISGYGCGEKEWIRRTLNGIGANKGMTKAQLERAISLYK